MEVEPIGTACPQDHAPLQWEVLVSVQQSVGGSYSLAVSTHRQRAMAMTGGRGRATTSGVGERPRVRKMVVPVATKQE